MKLEITNTKQRDYDEAVAYIDSDGDLVFMTTEKNPYYEYCAVSLPTGGLWDGSDKICVISRKWDPACPRNEHLFYPGDEVTIKF